MYFNKMKAFALKHSDENNLWDFLVNVKNDSYNGSISLKGDESFY